MLSNAYVAGLLDGEGWIGLATSKGYYRGRVTVGMTLPARQTLYDLESRWGGSVGMTRAATEKWAEAWAWTVEGAQARELLGAVLPHLRIKAKQAVLVEQVERLRRELPRRPNGSAEWNTGTRTRCAQIKAELHRLNMKGPRPAERAAGSMGKPLARWNPARGVWEVPQTESLLCEHLALYSATWPTSGTTRRGTAYAPPTSAHPTAGSVSSSSPALATPTAWLGRRDAHSVGDPERWTNPERSRELSDQIAHMMLPTPTSWDWKGPNQRRDATCLHGALLPTPAVNDMGAGKTVEAWDEWTAKMKAAHGNGNGHGPSLAIEAQRLLLLGATTSPPSDAGNTT